MLSRSKGISGTWNAFKTIACQDMSWYEVELEYRLDVENKDEASNAPYRLKAHLELSLTTWCYWKDIIIWIPRFFWKSFRLICMHIQNKWWCVSARMRYTIVVIELSTLILAYRVVKVSYYIHEILIIIIKISCRLDIIMQTCDAIGYFNTHFMFLPLVNIEWNIIINNLMIFSLSLITVLLHH